MKKQPIPQGFSPFAWGIAILCMPILLSPLTMLLSTSFTKNETLSPFWVNAFSLFFWIYPFILAIVARVLYVLGKRNRALASKWLIFSILTFWILAITICKIGFQL